MNTKFPSSNRGSFRGGTSDSKKSFGQRKSFGDRSKYGDKKSFGDKPSFGPRKSFGDRPSFGERKSFGDRPSFGDRKPFGSKKSFGDKPSFGDRKPFGDRRRDEPRRNFDERRSFGDKKHLERDSRNSFNKNKDESFPENKPFRASRDFTQDFDKKYTISDERISKMRSSMRGAQDSDDTIRPRKQRSYMRTTPQNETRTAETSWGDVASWYDEHLENNEDTYHRQVILPNLTRLITPNDDDKILEVACGQGFFTRRFQKEFRNATFEGIDLGEDLIKIASKREPNMKFSVGNAEELSQFENETFNSVYIVLAIQNIEHLDKLISEVGRVLKSGGTFHIVMNHPIFRIPKETSWEYVDSKNIQSRRIDAYLSELRTEIDMHPGIFNSPLTLSFHRPLQTYFKFIAKYHMAVDRLEEWISHKTSDSGPRAQAENKARKEFPMFMYIRCKKILN